MSQDHNNYSEQAREALRLAEEEARRFNHNYIGTEHLLLGLCRQREGVAARALDRLGVEPTKVRSAVEFIIGRGQQPVAGEIGPTPRARHVLELARDEARRLRSDSIGTEHLLLGLIREGEGIAAGVLESLGVNLERVRSEVTFILTGSPPAGEEPGTAPPVTRRGEFLVVQTVSREGSVWIHTVNGEEDPRFPAGRAALRDALGALGEEGWELVGIDPTSAVDGERGAIYLFSRDKR